MRLRRTLALTKRALTQFRHDRRTLGFVFFVPLLMVLVFGYTFGGEPKGLRVAVVDGDVPVFTPTLGENFSLSGAVIDNLNTETFVLLYYDSWEDAEAELQATHVWAVISFPENFTQNLVQRFYMGGNETSTIGLHVDDTNPNVVGTISKELQIAVGKTLDDMAERFPLPSNAAPIAVESTNEYAASGDIRFIDYFAPGVISFAIMMVTTMITIFIFISERRTGTLQRLLASPATEAEIVFGYALAFGVLGLMQSVVILIAAVLIFDITIVGNVLLALLVVLLIAVGHQGMGILLSAGARNELQAVQFVPLIIFPSVLLAGLFWPVEAIPSYLQPLSYFIPLRYGIDAERSIMLRGWGAGEVWVDIAVLIGFAALTLALSVLLLKRRR